MTTVDEGLKRNLKNVPILLINKRLHKYRKSNIPEVKTEKVKNLFANNNLF